MQRVSDLRAELLAFALSLPEAWEDHPWGERVAKVRGKVFVFFGRDDSTLITVKLAESHGHASSLPGVEPTRYGLGRSGCGWGASSSGASSGCGRPAASSARFRWRSFMGPAFPEPARATHGRRYVPTSCVWPMKSAE